METILYIAVDEIPEVNAFVAEIKALSLREQLARTREFVQSRFRNWLSPRLGKLSPDEAARLARARDQDEVRPLSECLRLGFGVCVEYHVLAKVVIDKLGIQCEFKVCEVPGAGGHTFLDVCVGGKWGIFDPFAEVYLRDHGAEGKLLDARYYRTSRTREQQATR